VAWAEAARQLASGRWKRVLLLGPPDAGKSTLARFLWQEADAAGLDVVVLDTDPGQKLIGPPTCVTLGQVGKDGGLALAALSFVAATDPVGAGARLLAASAELGQVAGGTLLLANTDGMLAGPGGRLKAALILAVRPDLLVAVGAAQELTVLLARHAELPALCLASSPLARRKTQAQRRETRCEAFRQHFASAAPWSVPTSKLLMSGEPPDATSRILVGLADTNGRDLALGLASWADAQSLAILTPASRGHVRRLRWSRLVLDEDFREIRYPRTLSPRGS
jgi:polynucleotide 5'-hydroxyl-kinase GRC3/NOL9